MISVYTCMCGTCVCACMCACMPMCMHAPLCVCVQMYASNVRLEDNWNESFLVLYHMGPKDQTLNY